MLRVRLISFLRLVASLNSETLLLLRRTLTRGKTSWPATSETTSLTMLLVILIWCVLRRRALINFSCP